jgi:hypothetical protein
MAAPKPRRAAVKKPKKPKKTLEVRVRVSPPELAELRILGGPGDFATNVRQILLDRARGERTRIPNAIELRRLQLYLIIDRQARLIRQRFQIPPQSPWDNLLRAIEQVGTAKEDHHASP